MKGTQEMAESRAHRRAKRQSAGRGGSVEVLLPSGRRLDALSRNGRWATEVERSRDFGRLWQAISRLVESGAPERVLKVPEEDMGLAAVVFRRAGISGRVRSLDGSQDWYIKVR